MVKAIRNVNAAQYITLKGQAHPNTAKIAEDI